MNSNSTNIENSPRDNYTLSLVTLTLLFFIWGFITSLNDILIPHLKGLFNLSYLQAMAVNLAFFGAYALMSYPAGIIVKRLGYQKGIVIGLIIAGFGSFLFYPAANVKEYWLFLASLFVLASGITLLQVSANPYVTRLGSEQSASSRLTMTQAFNSLGTTIAPIFGAAVILSVGANELASHQQHAEAVQIPYLGLSTTLFVLAIIFAIIKLPNITTDSNDGRNLGLKELFKHKHLVLGVLAIFIYVGAEVSIGSLLVNFFIEMKLPNVDEVSAAHLVAYYWGAAMVGRFVGAALMLKVAANKVLITNGVVAVMLLIVTVFSNGYTAVYAVLAVGLCNSIMFPTIFSLALKNLGPLSGKASGLLCVAIVGGALIPLLQGALADSIGIQLSFLLPIFCYLYISFYGFKGYKLK